MTEGSACADCGVVFTAQEEIPALGHTETILPAVPATHRTVGMTEGSYCPTCGEVFAEQEIIPMLALLQMKLPAGLTAIDEEAFLCSAAQCVILPDGCQTIAACAFAYCAQLQVIEIPASVTDIDPTAFAGHMDSLVILTTPGSAAQTFAETYGILCVTVQE